MTTIVLAAIKGGVGKSSTAIMVAKYLAKSGKRVLFGDMDPQNSSSFHFLDDQDLVDDKNIAIALQMGDLKGNIIESNYEGIDIIPCNFDLVNFRSFPVRTLQKHYHQIEDLYDYMIIDTAPTWDNIVLMAHQVADYIITPVRLAQFDWKGAKFYRQQLTDETDKVGKWFILNNFFKAPTSENMTNYTNQMIKKFDDEFDNILNIRVPITTG